MITFLKDLKSAELLYKKIQEDRHELQIFQNKLAHYLDGGLIMTSLFAGFIASSFFKTSQWLKILGLSYLKTFLGLRYI